MRTETTTRTLYTFDELPEPAQESALDHVRSLGWYNGSDWADEWRDTLRGACTALDITARDYEVSTYRPSFIQIEMDDDPGELIGVRAWKYLHAQGYAEAIKEEGSCPWTGYCGDESFLDPLRAFLKRPNTTTTLLELMQACGDSWVSGWVADQEYQTSDEAIRENLSSNDHEFLENGRLA